MQVKKVLLIDDEKDIRTVADISLRRIGNFDVTLVENGKEGLSAAAAIRPDVILLDMMMPEMDGITVLKKLKENPETRDIPVIFMTARVRDKEKTEYEAHGAKGVIDKPFDPLSLAGQVRKICDFEQKDAAPCRPDSDDSND
ncbi:MAG: Alkaline phosphatase synthesis transcriptional regulatory protein PhoP [bacterium ADurb.Bin236]|nr:MAG: Alkaline phosphatase synthesis transcriptional regulatory protein PhoP [bacterium ADurb.Bin236]HPN93259.1 response regulator [bacterium]